MRGSAVKNSPSIIMAEYNYLTILVCLFFCASCSLKPLYSSKYNAQELNQLNCIEVEEINSIEGSEFLYHLSNILPRNRLIDAKYLLKVKFLNSKLPSVIQKNSDVLWEIINQNVQYQLINIETGKKVTTGKFTHTNSYNIGSIVYSNYISSETASDDLTRQAAEEIFARLVIHFNNVNNNKN